MPTKIDGAVGRGCCIAGSLLGLNLSGQDELHRGTGLLAGLQTHLGLPLRTFNQD
jgi:hypothetical protein